MIQPEGDGAKVDKGFVLGLPVGDSELLLCHGDCLCYQDNACSDREIEQKFDLFNKDEPRLNSGKLSASKAVTKEFLLQP
jgi:hypothetical protein